MRLRAGACALLLLAAFAPAPPVAAKAKARKAKAAAARDEAAAVRAAFWRLVKAFRDRDARAVAALIAEDALLSHAGSRDRDYPALVEVFTKMLAPRPNFSETIEPELEEVQVSGDTAFLRITWRTKVGAEGLGRVGLVGRARPRNLAQAAGGLLEALPRARLQAPRARRAEGRREGRTLAPRSGAGYFCRSRRMER